MESRRWKFLRVSSLRWALVPATDELLYEILGVKSSFSQAQLTAAYNRDVLNLGAPDEAAKNLASPVYAGETLLGLRVVGWSILICPQLRILYHVVGYPLVFLVHLWLQGPERELSQLRMMELLGAIIAHERHGNSRAIRNDWGLLPGLNGDLPVSYAAFLQGALLVLERGTHLCTRFLADLDVLKTEGAAVDKALLRFLRSAEGRDVTIGIVPEMLGNEWRSMTHSPSGFIIALHLTAAQHRAPALSVSHWTAVEDATTTPLNRGLFQEEARRENPRLWLPPRVLTSTGGAATLLHELTVQLQPRELVLDAEVALRPGGEFHGWQGPVTTAPPGTWQCVRWRDQGFSAVPAEERPYLLPRPTPDPDASAEERWKEKVRVSRAQGKTMPHGIWDFRRAQLMNLAACLREAESRRQSHREETPAAAAATRAKPAPAVAPAPRVTEPTPYSRQTGALFGELVGAVATRLPGFDEPQTPTGRCQSWVNTTQVEAFSPEPAGIEISGAPPGYEAAAAVPPFPGATSVGGPQLPAAPVAQSQENRPPPGGRSTAPMWSEVATGSVPWPVRPGRSRASAALGAPPLRESQQTPTTPGTPGRGRKVGSGSGRSQSRPRRTGSRTSGSSPRGRGPPSSASSASSVVPPRWSTHFPAQTLREFPNLTPEAPPSGLAAFRAWGAVSLPVVPPGPAIVPTAAIPARNGDLVTFPWLVQQLARAGLHTEFSVARNALLMSRQTLPELLRAFLEGCKGLTSRDWDYEAALYNLLHWLPASLHLPGVTRPWQVRERIHRSLRALKAGWPAVFEAHPSLVAFYQQLAEVFTGVPLDREFPVAGILTPGAATAASIRTRARRNRRLRQLQRQQAAGVLPPPASRDLASSASGSAESDTAGMEGMESEPSLTPLVIADAVAEAAALVAPDPPQSSEDVEMKEEPSGAMRPELPSEELSQESEEGQGPVGPLRPPPTATAFRRGDEAVMAAVPTALQIRDPTELVVPLGAYELRDVYFRLPHHPTPPPGEEADWLATMDAALRVELELDMVNLQLATSMDTAWLWRHAGSWTGRRYLSLPLREPLDREVEALGNLEALDRFRVDAVGPVRWESYPSVGDLPTVRALCQTAFMLDVPLLWVLQVNPRARRAVDPWIQLVEGMATSASRPWRVCLLDPIAHPDAIRELCEQYPGRIALSFSSDGLNHPEVLRLLEAQPNPLLQVHSAEVIALRAAEEFQQPGWQIARAVAALAHLRSVPLGEMVDQLVQGGRRFWGVEPAGPPSAGQRALVQRALHLESLQM